MTRPSIPSPGLLSIFHSPPPRNLYLPPRSIVGSPSKTTPVSGAVSVAGGVFDIDHRIRGVFKRPVPLLFARVRLKHHKFERRGVFVQIQTGKGG